MQVSEGVLWTIFFKLVLKSKKQRTSKIIATQKCLNTFTGYFLYLKLSWKPNFVSWIIIRSLNVKKILEHIFWKFNMWKISNLKKFPVFRPLFLRRRLRRQGIIFFYFFLHILIDYFFNYKHCKFQRWF